MSIFMAAPTFACYCKPWWSEGKSHHEHEITRNNETWKSKSEAALIKKKWNKWLNEQMNEWMIRWIG